jgi:hypothetical protein
MPADDRRHDNAPVIPLRFKRVREQSEHGGVLLSSFDDGMKFIAGIRVGAGEILNVWVEATNGQEQSAVLRVTTCKTLEPTAEGRERFEVVGSYVAQGETYTGQDRRRHPRIPADFELTFTRQGSSVVHTGRVLDVSQGGLHFVTEQRLPRGELVIVTLLAGAHALITQDLASAMQTVDCRMAPIGPLADAAREPAKKQARVPGVSMVVKKADIPSDPGAPPPPIQFEIRARFLTR